MQQTAELPPTKNATDSTDSTDQIQTKSVKIRGIRGVFAFARLTIRAQLLMTLCIEIVGADFRAPQTI
jgi:hypothetical protein